MRDRDIRSLLIGYVVSAVGSGVGASALPIVAVIVLHVSAFDVSLLTGISGLAAAAIALPVGPVIEYRRKRPVMMTCDFVRFAALGSVPVAAVLHALTYPQLVAVGVITTAATIGFASASDANLKALTDTGTRTTVNSWFATSNWISVTAGPPVGGLLISGLGATVTTAIDAVSYLGSAAGVWRIRAAEPLPSARPAKSGVVDGWRYIFAHRGLRKLFFNAMAFGGPVIMTSPLTRCSSWTCSSCPRARTDWRWACLGGTCAGIFNPVFATYRMNVTTDSYMARVASAWGISSKTVQPVCVLIGGGLAALIGVRPTILFAALACTLSGVLLPFRTLPTEELNLLV